MAQCYLVLVSSLKKYRNKVCSEGLSLNTDMYSIAAARIKGHVNPKIQVYPRICKKVF